MITPQRCCESCRTCKSGCKGSGITGDNEELLQRGEVVIVVKYEDRGEDSFCNYQAEQL